MRYNNYKTSYCVTFNMGCAYSQFCLGLTAVILLCVPCATVFLVFSQCKTPQDSTGGENPALQCLKKPSGIMRVQTKPFTNISEHNLKPVLNAPSICLSLGNNSKQHYATLHVQVCLTAVGSEGSVRLRSYTIQGLIVKKNC